MWGSKEPPTISHANTREKFVTFSQNLTISRRGTMERRFRPSPCDLFAIESSQ